MLRYLKSLFAVRVRPTNRTSLAVEALEERQALSTTALPAVHPSVALLAAPTQAERGFVIDWQASAGSGRDTSIPVEQVRTGMVAPEALDPLWQRDTSIPVEQVRTGAGGPSLADGAWSWGERGVPTDQLSAVGRFPATFAIPRLAASFTSPGTAEGFNPQPDPPGDILSR